ncbi:hypothetical protein FDI24_gp222 [Acidovorax phage ACP17]|uniref:Uncharacterized protein n=1 Tax=Acidovorax phage ACP17 TaxID=2010329 RepID=A0A218M381_9CAUD|nr:hypothetical protein FDI24_gp222 [Acidovorax phage ACP17]ASD50503.1 hypothetical protein [Acidovorax phage ACP17]
MVPCTPGDPDQVTQAQKPVLVIYEFVPEEATLWSVPADFFTEAEWKVFAGTYQNTTTITDEEMALHDRFNVINEEGNVATKLEGSIFDASQFSKVVIAGFIL